MTLMEILLVVSLVSMVSVALYKVLSQGLRVWERSQQFVAEEDIAIFFEKITADLRNSYVFSKNRFEGTENKFIFPTIVRVAVDAPRGVGHGELADQIGRVEYFYDGQHRAIYKRTANYSRALRNTFDTPQFVAGLVDRLTFRYLYLTDNGELFSSKVLDVIPAGVDVEVLFSDKNGQRSMHKFVEIPIGS